MTKKTKSFLTVVLAVVFILSISILGYSQVFADRQTVTVAQAAGGSQAQTLVYAADVISVSGNNFRIKRINSPHYMKGRVNMPNYVRDLLETDGDTVAAIEFTDGSQLGINANTQIEIVSVADAKDITNRGFVEKVVLKSGTIWAKISGRDTKGFKVETGKGVIGVRGTEFIVETDEEGKEKVTVLSGSVDYTPEGKKTEVLNPGDEIVFDMYHTVDRRHQDVRDLRNAVNLRFPGLNPVEQTILSVFKYHVIGSIPGAGNALYVANQTMNFIENPEQFVADRAVSEIRSKTGLPIPGISLGGGKKKQEVKPIQNLKPDGVMVETYYPEFTWDKTDGADTYRVLITRKPLVKGETDPGYIAVAQVKENRFRYSQTARALRPNDRYYWTVIPMNKDNKPTAPPSNPARLVMADFQSLGIRGLHPVGEADGMTGELVFDWTPVRGTNSYHFEISEDRNFETLIHSDKTEINTVAVENPYSILSRNKQYYWRAYQDEVMPGTPVINCEAVEFIIK
jgi:hypothetical protein